MSDKTAFHVVTVGWGYELIEGLANAIAAKSADRFSHITHPNYTLQNWLQCPPQAGIHFFRDDLEQKMPEPDQQLLGSLEQDDIPSIHNMILGDRIVSKIQYVDALRYATFLARRLIDLYSEIEPSVVIGGFDSIHAGIALAVARRMNIPWFVLHFCSLPSGYACFCDGMSPAAGVRLRAPEVGELQSFADATLRKFEAGTIEAGAYIAPPPLSFAGKVVRLPSRLLALHRIVRKARMRDTLQFTEASTGHSLLDALKHIRDTAGARKAVSMASTLSIPPESPYVFFGLHMQPESSIDVWAPFFSNQTWVLELLSRSIPPTHKLLVKIHRSDLANYSRAQFERMSAIPGIQLVAPSADSRAFIEHTDLLVAIQGTLGLEAALLGKPVIMLGDSAVDVFPSVSSIGKISDLPSLVRNKLKETPASRSDIVDAYAAYLEPFFPAGTNRWYAKKSKEEIDGFRRLFEALKGYVMSGSETSPHVVSSSTSG